MNCRHPARLHPTECSKRTTLQQTTKQSHKPHERSTTASRCNDHVNVSGLASVCVLVCRSPRDTRGLGLFPGLIKRIHILANTAWRSTELSSVLRGSTQCLPLILSGSGLGAHRVSHIHQVAFNTTTTTTTTTHTYLQSHLHGEAVAVSVRPRERGQPISLSTGASGRPVQSSPGE